MLVVEDNAGGPLRLPADKVLVTVGRRPEHRGLGPGRPWRVDMAGPFVKVDDRAAPRCGTSGPSATWSASRCSSTRPPRRARWSPRSSPAQRRRFDPVAIAAVCFTEPEIVSAGLAPDEARAAGRDVLTGVFPFSANGRARLMDAADDGGFVRVVAGETTTGSSASQAVGAHVSELSGEFALALEMGARLEDIAGTIHVHPTLQRSVPRGGAAALGPRHPHLTRLASRSCGKIDPATLDPTRRILDLIQHDASLSVAQIAERVGLSSSPCWRRIKRLEEEGVIQRRVTILDREKLGLTFEVYCTVKLTLPTKENLDTFERIGESWPRWSSAPPSPARPTTSCASSPATCTPSTTSCATGSCPWPGLQHREPDRHPLGEERHRCAAGPDQSACLRLISMYAVARR